VNDEGFLASLTEAERTGLEATGRRRDFPAGQILFTEGDDGHEVFVLLGGQVKVVTTAPSGRDVILDVMDEDSLLGELSAIDGNPRSATAIALTPVTVLCVSTEDFLAFLEHNGPAATALLRLVAARLRRSSQRQLEFGTSDALGRLCTCLLTMLDRYGTGEIAHRRVTMPLAQHEIAAMTGLSREAVVKGLRAMRSLDWIDTQAREVMILDEEAMRARAAG
jgi:CRP/FNR family transcriptional regulator, cyclic AMP receptor protein